MMTKKNQGKLILIPTPIDEESPLESVAFNLLNEKASSPNYKNQSVFAIEDLKPGRARWLRFGLPRQVVDDFVLFNEHTQIKLADELIQKMQAGMDIYLMSDGGLPAFCDPGQYLVSLCHDTGIKVTATPFPNSIALSLALSGFSHHRFSFFGFLSRDREVRQKEWQELSKRLKKETVILLDTPYRLERLVSEASHNFLGRKINAFLALDLADKNQEKLLRMSLTSLLKHVREHELKRSEFVLILSESF